jgi:DNA ligase-1
MQLSDIVETSARVAATPARSAKVRLIAELLGAAGADEVELAASYLTGELRQRRTGVGWAALRDLGTPPADGSTLTIDRVDAVFQRISELSGAGSAQLRSAALAELFGDATAAEQRFLVALATGELRQGAVDGVMVDAVAKAAGIPLPVVRRAAMLRGSLPLVAVVAIRDGADALAAIGLEVGRPVQPMLAQPAASIADALSRAGGHAALEWKLDGIRVQLHRRGDDVWIFTRTLDDITDRLPEVVELAKSLSTDEFVLDGEVLALDESGRPLAFQQTAARTSSRLDVQTLRASVPVRFFAFDILHVGPGANAEDVMSLPAADRQRLLQQVVPDQFRVPRLVTDDAAAAVDFFARAMAAGHEGVVVKSLDAPYAAGRRGAGWLKVKPRHTLDLVVLAAEWGHGRRAGKLSNLHLGARSAAGGFVMLGKTFKGLTDELLAWQTARFLELETRRDSYTVYVRPELVVEIAFDGVQASSRYPGGVTLRFARVLRYRPDKIAAQADLIDEVRDIHAGLRGPS